MSKANNVGKEQLAALMGAALLFILVALSYYYSLSSSLAGLRYVPNQASPDYSAQNIVLSEFDNTGTAKHRILAKDFQHFSDNRIKAVFPKFITLSPNKAPLSIESDRAFSNDGLETLDLIGKVRMKQDAYKTRKKLTLTTESMTAYLDTQRLKTKQPVQFKQNNDLTTSEGGMTFDNVTHTLTLEKQVYSKFAPR